MSFSIEQAIQTANQAVAATYGRSLTDIEIIVLKGAWERNSYDQIAAQNQYSTSYISQDIAPKLWKLLSDATGEKIKKNSLREPLKRYWEMKLELGIPTTKSLPQETKTSPSPLLITAAENSDDTTLPYSTYVRIPDIEELCSDTLINHPGTLIRIKSPQLTGKTSLIDFLIGKLSTVGIHAVSLSLRMADRKIHFSNMDRFLRWFCFNVEQELGLESQLEQYWNVEWLGSKVSCTTYFEKYLLAQDNLPIVLCLDDVDLLFSYPDIYEDFFGLLRSWYEKARSRSQWRRLRLVLAHSTQAYIPLNINQSPFNVGLPIELPEFNLAQATELCQKVGLNLSPTEIQSIMVQIGGHPYLLEKAFSYLKANPAVALDEFLAAASTQSGIYRNHLHEIWQQLRTRPDLESAFLTVINSTEGTIIQPSLAYQLQSMGLVTMEGNVAKPSFNIYRDYFLHNIQSAG